MYGSVSSQSSNDRTTSLAAVCGFAAVIAVAGVVGYTAPTALHAATAVRPAVQVAAPVAFAPIAGTSRVPVAAAPAAYVMQEDSVTSKAAQVVGTILPFGLGLAALIAFVSALCKKEATSSVYAAPVAMAATSGERLVWLPGATPPAHLTGQYPGDRGFDPLGFSKDPKAFERMRISEVFHGRLAMLGIVGCIAPELLFQRDTWFAAGSSVDVDRAGAILLQCIAPVEYWRGNGGFTWNGSDVVSDKNYPGFDPLGITSEWTKVAEIKNGRLAMIGMLGLEVQNHITGKSPLANLGAHLADPLHVNITSSLAMFSTSGSKTDRPLWFPGGYSPAWLTGEYPGDRGFDPAGLAADPKTYERMRLSEVFHGRLAMLAMVGAIVPDYLGRGAWYEAPDLAGIGVEQVLTVVAISGLPEIFRGQGGLLKGQTDKSYPGFDPLNLTTAYTKEAEIKNGRLAMIGMLGLEAQHHVTGESPIANLLKHWDHPLNNNIANSVSHPWPVAMFAASGQKERPVWFPNAVAPAWLNGEYPGDRGFDPFSLAKDPADFAKYRDSEVFHGRWAMLGIVGCLVPELLQKIGGPVLPQWYNAGAAVYGDGIDYLGNPEWIHAKNASLILFTTFLFMGPVEAWRWNGAIASEAKTTERTTYPGGFFDPLKLGASPERRLKEIKNGRLAMVGMVGFWAQSYITGEGPLANLSSHLSDPVHKNILSSVAMFATAGHKDGLWFPGTKAPAHLTGEYPADRGFDPLGLAVDPTVYARMRVSEVFHGRLAMLGVVGSILPELLGKGAWFQAGDVVSPEKVGFVLMAIAAPTEYWRSQGGFGWDKGTYDRSYPGADPLKLTNDRNKTAEIKNGRLAMLAIAGFGAQYKLTGASPLANLAAHLSNPVGANIITSHNVAMF